MLVGLEERADVDGLAAPEVAVDGPVKRQLQRAFVQDSALSQYLSFFSLQWYQQDLQGWVAGHGCSSNVNGFCKVFVFSSSCDAGREVDFVAGTWIFRFRPHRRRSPKHKTSPALQQKQDKQKKHFSLPHSTSLLRPLHLRQ
ncbi:hypothetical protein TRV_05528 [Trichophyton verrucosum HKI 0517]|uniref:Uncharacterized protein n=1 Tax=Trichophyton verrucosum (strain HKI 0517) TaxID=663202 RepID=D4DEG1_TRIVH|nr:uncharacterized protein TRV_05528 [Trichophyton verrucosum HKI 0517]EFE39792.1 hypothetical protein TRV_05528 [Trichophyton verrucosum HKI 0517]